MGGLGQGRPRCDAQPNGVLSSSLVVADDSEPFVDSGANGALRYQRPAESSGWGLGTGGCGEAGSRVVGTEGSEAEGRPTSAVADDVKQVDGAPEALPPSEVFFAKTKSGPCVRMCTCSLFCVAFVSP